LIRFFPVDELDGLGDVTSFDLYRNAIAKKAVNSFVVLVEATVGIVRLCLEDVDSPTDLLPRIAVLGKVFGQKPFLDVAISGAITPVAEVSVVKLVAE